MKRLTKKDKRTLSGYYIPTDYSNYHEKEFIKLGQLEDLEEELGIDLITLFKAKKEGIYYKTINHNIYYISKNCLCLEFNYEWELWVENHSILNGLLIHLKDYGKTWSLRKEDLEDEKED